MFNSLKSTETRTVKLGEQEIPYLLKRSSRRRSIALSVDDRGLIVSVPWRTSERRLNKVLIDASSWVLKKIDVWRAHQPRPKTWRQGETLKYLGQTLHLELAPRAGNGSAWLEGDRLWLRLPEPHEPGRVEMRVVTWYRAQALAWFQQRIECYAPRLGVAPPRLRLSDARTRWGSCNARGEIRMNWRLIQAPERLIDYVVAHELAHLKEMNHSPQFWRAVESICPDYADARSELNNRGRLYMEL